MKRIASIQDISCLGRCSLTVALPVISAMAVECAIVPTAVLSTHTMFPGFISRDLSDGNGVHIDDAVDALIFVLQRDPVFDRPHIRAERQIAAGLDTGKNTFLFGHDTSFFLFDSWPYHTTNRPHPQSMIDCF